MNWTRVAYSTDASEVLPAFDRLEPWEAPAGVVPPYPVASNLAHAAPVAAHSPAARPESGELREELRRLIIEELSTIIRG